MDARVLVVLVVVLVALPLVALISALLQPASSWDDIGKNKTLWVILVLFGPFLWIVYLSVVRPELRRSHVRPVGATRPLVEMPQNQTVPEQLLRLEALLERETISDEEFAKAKKNLLS